MAVLGALFAWAVCACLTAIPLTLAWIVLRRPLRWLWQGTSRGAQAAGPVYGWAWRELRRQLGR